MLIRSNLRCAALAVGILAACCVTVSAVAQTSMPAAPSTMPTSAPAVPVDTTSPRGTLKVLMSAMQSGDEKSLRSLMDISSPIEQKMVDAMAKRAVIEARFRAAATKAFGDDKAKTLVGDSSSALAEGMSKVDESKEAIDGDKATVSSDGGAPPLTLKKVGGAWKIPAGELAKGVDPKELDHQLDDMLFAANSIDQFSGDLESGKYKTVEEAGNALRQQMMMDMMKRNSATTQASTEPSGGATMPSTSKSQ